MQKDFHYEATYFAARLAEFDHADAHSIAWAAQYIDDATDVDTKTVKLVGGGTYDFTNILTANTIPVGSGLTMRDDKHRQIWALFHFPPGNYLAYGKPKRDEHVLRRFRGVDVPKPGEAYSAPDLDKEAALSKLEADKLSREHFPMITRPYSDLVLSMLEHTKTAYDELVASGDTMVALNLLGVRMHVFADTWAHQDHIGAPDRRFNRVESFEWDRAKGKWNDDLTFEPGGDMQADDPGGSQGFATHKRNSNAWLGHGPMGSWPDIPWAVYKWQPRYAKDNDVFLRKNPEQYVRAFANLVHAMKQIRAGQAWAPIVTAKQIKDVLGDWLAVFKDAIITMQNLEGKKKTLMNPSGTERRLIDEERAAIWKTKFADLGTPEYDKDQGTRELSEIMQRNKTFRKRYPVEDFMASRYFGFHQAAKVHYRFMRNELRSQGFRIIFNDNARQEAMVDDYRALHAEKTLELEAARDEAAKKGVTLVVPVGFSKLLAVRARITRAIHDCMCMTDSEERQVGLHVVDDALKAKDTIPGIYQELELQIIAAKGDTGNDSALDEAEIAFDMPRRIRKRLEKLRDELKEHYPGDVQKPKLERQGATRSLL